MADAEPTWLTVDEILHVHNQVLASYGGADGIRDRSLLESAVGKPQNIFYYAGEEDISELAAAYAEGIARNHSFVDGNKRTALVAADTFLRQHGRELAPERESGLSEVLNDLSQGDIRRKGLTEMVDDLAQGKISREEFASYLRANSKPIGPVAGVERAGVNGAGAAAHEEGKIAALAADVSEAGASKAGALLEAARFGGRVLGAAGLVVGPILAAKTTYDANNNADKAVKDGMLTEAQAAQYKNIVKAGEIAGSEIPFSKLTANKVRDFLVDNNLPDAARKTLQVGMPASQFDRVRDTLASLPIEKARALPAPMKELWQLSTDIPNLQGQNLIKEAGAKERDLIAKYTAAKLMYPAELAKATGVPIDVKEKGPGEGLAQPVENLADHGMHGMGKEIKKNAAGQGLSS